MGKLKIKNLTPKDVLGIELSYKKYYDFISEITQLFPNASSTNQGKIILILLAL